MRGHRGGDRGPEKWPACVLLTSQCEAVMGMGGTSRRLAWWRRNQETVPLWGGRGCWCEQKEGAGEEAGVWGGSSVRYSWRSSRSVLCFLLVLC